jgi:hypothetical protein
VSRYDLYFLKEEDGLWVVHVSRDDQPSVPWGYCCAWEEHTRESFNILYGEHVVEYLLLEQEKKRQYQSKHHHIGHATREDAQACFWEYTCDQGVDLTPLPLVRRHTVALTCAMPSCGKEAALMFDAIIPARTFSVCIEHALWSSLKVLMPPDSLLADPIRVSH